jgi:serine/threonine-protein kinase
VQLPVEVGETIDGRYRVERVLGRGGMGVVFAAKQLRLGQSVAIKFPLAHLGLRRDIVERLLREARAAMQIRSEHVARVLDVGVHGGGAYLVMEFLVGQDLGSKLEAAGPLPCDAAIEYVLQACEALAEAHAAGIVHRDLKPSNLFLSARRDGSPLVKVIDFGLAKSLSSEEQMTLTDSGALLGSPLFMAPEQMRGAGEIDARADIFSLGATLYALLTGQPPFPGKTVLDVHDLILVGPPSLSAKRSDISLELDAAVQRCLRASPEERFADIAELAEALASSVSAHIAIHARRARGILSAPTAAQPDPVSARSSALATATTAPSANDSFPELGVAPDAYATKVSLAVSAKRTSTVLSPPKSWLMLAIAALALGGTWLAFRSEHRSSAVEQAAASAPTFAHVVAPSAPPPTATSPAAVVSSPPRASAEVSARLPAAPLRAAAPLKSSTRPSEAKAAPAHAAFGDATKLTAPKAGASDPLADPN